MIQISPGMKKILAGFLVLAGAAGGLLLYHHAAPPSLSREEITGGLNGSNLPELVVYIAGAVKVPGVYSLPPGSRVQDAVRKAGGATPQADLERINLAERLQDEDMVVVPRKGGEEAQGTPHQHGDDPGNSRRPSRGNGSVSQRWRSAGRASTGAASFQQTASSASSRYHGLIHLNTATFDELVSLPGVGERLAQRILEARKERGRFTSVEELEEIPGIGKKKLEHLRPYVDL